MDGKGSGEDWSYPVAYPLRTGEKQHLGTGYGTTVGEKMTSPTVIHFMLARADLLRYSRMADDALYGDAEAAGAYMKAVARLSKGQMTTMPLKFELGDNEETIRWMTFKTVVVVPRSFRGTRSP